MYVTYQQNGETVLEKTLEDVTVTETAITIALTQEETLAFSNGMVQIQIRAKFLDGAALASNILATSVEKILKDGVI